MRQDERRRREIRDRGGDRGKEGKKGRGEEKRSRNRDIKRHRERA